MFDVIVVGGSYAGMSAALQLARGRRKVAVLDAGMRRNRFASAAHSALGHDGEEPSAIWSRARDQLLAYPTITWRETDVTKVKKADGEFQVQSADSSELSGKLLVLATGVRDELPEIPGLRERWGQTVFHCPYCHGYELGEGKLGVLATSEMAMHQALLIPEWGETTFFTNGLLEPDPEQRAQLTQKNVTVESEPVTELSGSGSESITVHLRDGREITLAGLFVAPRMEAGNPLTEQLGCELTETPIGTMITTNELKETTVAGVYACGDAAKAPGNITFAIADGAMAGLATHRSLMFDGLD